MNSEEIRGRSCRQDWHFAGQRVRLTTAVGHFVRTTRQIATMVNEERPIYRYVVDKSDIIIDVDDWWLAFAKENNADELNRTSVIDQCLWDFIVDEPTRSLYQVVHAHVRATETPVTIPFRCDSPTLQRHMELTVHPHVSGQLRYESRVVRVVPQATLSTLRRAQKRSLSFLTMCSFCKRSLIEPSGWLDLADISLTLHLFDQEVVPQLRYTVCPECVGQSERLLQQI